MNGPAERQITWARHIAATSALRELQLVLGVSGVLPVKGVVTARTLYADVAERPITDLDVRVRARSLPILVEAASRRGWTIVRNAPAYDNLVLLVAGVSVDVEAHVGPPGLCRLRVEQMLERAHVDPSVFGFRCALPDPVDHALLLCINAFKDKLVTAPAASVEDLLRLARAAEFDAGTLARRARAVRAAAMVWIVADWLAPKSKPWAEVRDALGIRPPRPAFVHAYRALVAWRPLALPTRLLARAGSDSVVDRVRALVRAAAWVGAGHDWNRDAGP